MTDGLNFQDAAKKGVRGVLSKAPFDNGEKEPVECAIAHSTCKRWATRSRDINRAPSTQVGQGKEEWMYRGESTRSLKKKVATRG